MRIGQERLRGVAAMAGLTNATPPLSPGAASAAQGSRSDLRQPLRGAQAVAGREAWSPAPAGTPPTSGDAKGTPSLERVSCVLDQKTWGHDKKCKPALPRRPSKGHDSEEALARRKHLLVLLSQVAWMAGLSY